MSNADTDFNNLLETFGTLLPSVYSKKAFIEYIERWLKLRGNVGEKYIFQAGPGLTVTVKVDALGQNVVKYSIVSTDHPTANVPITSAEYGESFAIGELSALLTVTRRSFALKEITWADVIPNLQLEGLALATILEGQTFQQVVANQTPVNGETTIGAVAGTFSDINGNGGSLNLSLTRQTRHFWGVISNSSDPIVPTVGFSSNLGSLPRQIPVDHSGWDTHLVVITTDNIEVFANGFGVGIIKLSGQMLNPYAEDLSYAKAYNVYISTGKATGEYIYTTQQI
jgi:hypothetical protein